MERRYAGLITLVMAAAAGLDRVGVGALRQHVVAECSIELPISGYCSASEPETPDPGLPAG
jgi:hypothetical protein